MIWICKMCGRSLRSDDEPVCCYFDRMDAIENISDDDSVRMGIRIKEGDKFEFPGDVKWDPFTGYPSQVIGTATLRQFQESIMEKVRREET